MAKYFFITCMLLLNHFTVQALSNDETRLNTHHIILDADFRTASTEQKMWYMEDTTRALTAVDIASLEPNSWQLTRKKSINLGTSESVFWFKLTLENIHKESQSVVLLNTYAPTNFIDAYVVEHLNHIPNIHSTGDRRPSSARPIPHASFAMPFHVPANSDKTVLIKVETNGNVVVPISVWSSRSFSQYQATYFLIFGTLIGILCITCVYNLFVHLQTKERIFLSFSAFILSVMFLVIHQSGIGMLLIWPNSPIFNEFGAGLSITLGSIGHIIFFMHYLEVNKRVKQVCTLFALLSLGITLAYPILPYSTIIHTNLMLGSFGIVLSLLYAIWLSNNGNNTAKLFVYAWTPFIVGSVVSASIRFELIDYSLLTEFSGLFFAVATIVWLSISISERLNREKLSRIDAQNASIKSLERYEDLFEKAVEGLFTSTASGKLLSANNAFVNMLGYDNYEQLHKQYGNNTFALYKQATSRQTLISKAKQHGSVVDQEIEMLKANGVSFWVSCTLRLIANDNPEDPIVQGAMIDVSARKLSEMKLEYLANHDPLTNLLNRRAFENKLRETVESEDTKTIRGSLLYLDLDQFKIVNDTCGHTIGDKLLVKITKIMQEAMEHQGILGRLGGDEFGILLKHYTQTQAIDVANCVLKAVSDFRFEHNSRVFNLGVSIGLVEITRDISTIEDAMSFADTACYSAKDAGRNRIEVYSSSNEHFSKRRLEMDIANAVTDALRNNHFTLYRQKIVHNNDEFSTYGYEVLLRMQDQGEKSYSPAEFIPAAEKYGLMHKVDEWVIEHTFAWLNNNPKERDASHLWSINLSGQSIGQDSLQNHIVSCFKRYNIACNKICFEITETHAINNIEHTVNFITYFQTLGCTFSLDDFGSGLSSYGYLKALPLDNIKIDGRFVKGITADKADYAMVESIHAVSRAMGKLTIAEYVEDTDIIKQLKHIGIDYLQGYAIQKPSPMQ
ncbi:MAG: EAL domain-containing protein [Glaciecola sp.]